MGTETGSVTGTRAPHFPPTPPVPALALPQEAKFHTGERLSQPRPSPLLGRKARGKQQEQLEAAACPQLRGVPRAAAPQDTIWRKVVGFLTFFTMSFVVRDWGEGGQSKPCQSLCSESYSSSAPTQRTPSRSIGVPWCRSVGHRGQWGQSRGASGWPRAGDISPFGGVLRLSHLLRSPQKRWWHPGDAAPCPQVTTVVTALQVTGRGGGGGGEGLGMGRCGRDIKR